jgi:hypothetical protein
MHWQERRGASTHGRTVLPAQQHAGQHTLQDRYGACNCRCMEVASAAAPSLIRVHSHAQVTVQLKTHITACSKNSLRRRTTTKVQRQRREWLVHMLPTSSTHNPKLPPLLQQSTHAAAPVMHSPLLAARVCYSWCCQQQCCSSSYACSGMHCVSPNAALPKGCLGSNIVHPTKTLADRAANGDGQRITGAGLETSKCWPALLIAADWAAATACANNGQLSQATPTVCAWHKHFTRQCPNRGGSKISCGDTGNTQRWEHRTQCN